MTKRAHLRSIAIATLLSTIPNFTVAATFQGPASSPPSGNAPGVIWNMKDNPAQIQSGAVINIPGLRNDPITKDVYLENGKTFRVEGSNSTSYQFGNWNGGSQKGLMTYFNGDIQVTDFGAAAGERGRVQATEFCFNPGGAADCIYSWPVAGPTGSFVVKTGDTMSGPLQVLKNFSGSVGSTSTVNISSTALLGTTFTEINGLNVALSPPNSANAASTLNGTKVLINQSGASGSLYSSAGVFANNSNSGATNDYAYGGNFLANVNNNGRIVQETAGVHGQYQSTTDFNTINRALGVYGEAYNLSPTKSPNYLYGVQGYAQGKSLIESAGVLGSNFVNSARTTPQMGVFGITTLSTGGTASNAYGVRGSVAPNGGSATNAYGVYGSTVGVTATNEYGVYGTSDSTGVYGTGLTGVYGNGTTYGGFFTSPLWGVYGTASALSGAGVRGAAGTGSFGVYGSAAPGKTAVLAESETLNQGTPLVSRYGSIGADISGATYGIKVRGNQVGIDISAAGVIGIRASSTNQAAVFDNNTNGVYSRAQANALDGRTYGGNALWSGVYGESELAAGNGGHFNNPAASTEVFLASNGYSINALGPVNVKNTSNVQMFYINNSGDVHSNGPVSGFYFHDRTTPATKFNAWYTYTDGVGTMARLYSNQIGDMLKVNWANGQIFNYANTASFNIASDERLKDIHGEYTKGLEVLSQINPIIFNYKKNNPQKIESTITHQGVSAQELLKVLPEAVHMGEDGYLTVNNDPIIWASVNSIKQLKSENEELKSKVQSLEERLNKLEEKLK